MTSQCEAFRQALNETQNQQITWSRESYQDEICNNTKANYTNKTNFINSRFTKAEKWKNLKNFGTIQGNANKVSNAIFICNQNK